MKKLPVIFLVSMICVLVAQATEFCSIDVYPTDNLAVFVYKDGGFTRLHDMRVTFSETMEGVFVNGVLIVKRKQQTYSPETISLHSRHEIVKDAVARGEDLYDAVKDYMERHAQILDAVITAFIGHIDTLPVIDIVPLLENVLDRLDPDRIYITRFEPDDRCVHCVFVWSPHHYWLQEQLGTAINPLTISKYCKPRDPQSADRGESPIRPFLNCAAIEAAVESAKRKGSRIQCITIGGMGATGISAFVDEEVMLHNIRSWERIVEGR